MLWRLLVGWAWCRFCQEKGLTPYTQVLHPRSGAFIAATSTLAAHGHLDALYDVTMAYVDYQTGERPSELSVLKGANEEKGGGLCGAGWRKGVSQ